MSSYGDSLKAKTFNCSTITCSDLIVKVEAASPGAATVGQVGQLFFCKAGNADGGGVWICTAVTVNGETTTYTWLQLSSSVDEGGGGA